MPFRERSVALALLDGSGSSYTNPKRERGTPLRHPKRE